MNPLHKIIVIKYHSQLEKQPNPHDLSITTNAIYLNIIWTEMSVNHSHILWFISQRKKHSCYQLKNKTKHNTET